MLLRDSTNNYRGGVRFEYQPLPRDPGAGRHHLQGRRPGQYQRRQLRRPHHAAAGRHLGAEQPDAGLRNSRPQHLHQGAGHGQSRSAGWTSTASSCTATRKPTRATSTSPPATSPCSARLLLYSGQYNIGTSAANRAAHHRPTSGVEIRPFRRLRIIESFTTDRYARYRHRRLTEQILLSPGRTCPALATALSTAAGR